MSGAALSLISNTAKNLEQEQSKGGESQTGEERGTDEQIGQGSEGSHLWCPYGPLKGTLQYTYIILLNSQNRETIAASSAPKGRSTILKAF